VDRFSRLNARLKLVAESPKVADQPNRLSRLSDFYADNGDGEIVSPEPNR
jgi:hypothetical protein